MSVQSEIRDAVSAAIRTGMTVSQFIEEAHQQWLDVLREESDYADAVFLKATRVNK